MENKVNVTVKKLPKSTIEFSITASNEEFKKELDLAYNKLSPKASIKGFRKGMAPRNLIIEALGTKLYDEALNLLLVKLTDKALQQEKIVPINPPSFKISKFDPESDIEFSVTFATYPTIKIGDLKNIKVDKKDIEKARTKRDKIKEETLAPKENNEKNKEVKEEEKDSFKLEEYYSKIIDDIFEISEFEIPDYLTESELTYQENNFKAKLTELGIKVEDYLSIQNTSIEELRENWRKNVDFSIKQDLLLAEYAKDKKIEVSDEDISKMIGEVYKDKASEIDEKMRNYIRFNQLKQKSFLDLINFIEENNVNTNSN